jgi:hypothetical protein
MAHCIHFVLRISLHNTPILFFKTIFFLKISREGPMLYPLLPQTPQPSSPSLQPRLCAFCTLHCNHSMRTSNHKHFYVIYFNDIDSMCKSTNRLDRHSQRRYRPLQHLPLPRGLVFPRVQRKRRIWKDRTWGRRRLQEYLFGIKRPCRFPAFE